MGLPLHARDVLEPEQRDFDIVAEYQFLSAQRQSVLCEQLFLKSQDVFQDTVELLWPHAAERDGLKLAKHLYLLKRHAH